MERGEKKIKGGEGRREEKYKNKKLLLYNIITHKLLSFQYSKKEEEGVTYLLLLNTFGYLDRLLFFGL